MAKRRTPFITACLILINAKLYEAEREKEITRYRFSLQTLRRLSGRRAIRISFIAQLEDELADLGWFLIPLGAEYAVMEVAKTASWVKLSSKRIIESDLLNADEGDIESKFYELLPEYSEDINDTEGS